MTQRQRSPRNISWEKKRWDTMAKPPHTGGEMGVLYLICWRRNDPHDGGTYMDPPALSRGSRMEQHVSGQMPPYIRPLGEDLLWSSGPDEICASSPDHDHGLTGPVPTQVGRKSV